MRSPATPTQLSLFDDDGASPSTASGAGAPNAPVAETPAPSAAAETPQLVVPDLLLHPRAAREIVLQGTRVGYEFRTARRRSIGMAVGVDGLSVSAPRWVRRTEIDEALHERAGWILRKLAEQRDRAQRLQATRVHWREGASVPFLGEPVVMVIDPRVAGAVLHEGARGLPGVARRTLHVGLAQQAGAAQLREAVQSWLKRQALRVFEQRCAHFAPRLRVTVRRLSLSSATTRWGSASADGSIWLHWRLVHFSLPVIDYVVAHELAHLREMNHSRAFWAVVRSVVPDFERTRRALDELPVPLLD
ncbi:MAG: M48 family metallopeptidase [Ideonella sp.]|nr:M48 family metallopeptidase [Ideonella sp.]MCC7458888.1 M48 family metallopeptidase [Nitrospira sp.]